MGDFKEYLKYINNCDKGQPLISETGLGYHLEMIPLDRVQQNHFTRLYQDLNREQLITTKQGIARDYRGLAELMGFSTLDIEAHFKKSINPTKSAIEAYMYKKHDNRGKNKPVTLNDLIKMIERIERYDVVDDFIPGLVKIAAQYSSSNSFDEGYRLIEQPRLPIAVPQDTLVSNTRLLTIDDTRQPSGACYDAFVCYAPEDQEHAESLISFLEQRGKTLATASDLLPGNFEHDSLVQLIDTRCRKVIIILTHNFLRSKECEFQTKFASEIGIKAGSPKIIPVLCESCNDALLPPLIRVISKIDLANTQSRTWQLNKLLGSLTPIAENQADNAQIRNQPCSVRLQGLQDQSRTEPGIYSATDSYQDLRSNSSPTDTTCCNSPTNQLGPIVELMHSEVSDQGSCEPEPQKDLSSIDKDSSNKPLNWLKKFRRATSGSQSISNRSSSSRAGLLSDSSAELISEECPIVNMRT